MRWSKARAVDETEGMPLPGRYWAILTIALGLCTSVITGTITNVALPTISRDLSTDPSMLLSNTNIIHWEWAEKNCFSYKGYQASDFFNNIYLSYELHLQKPDPEIYKYVLKDAAIIPEETFFIDDTALNCRAAEALGIHTYTPDPREDWSYLFK